MALVNCKECGKEISDKAATCPNCGCPVEHNVILPTISNVKKQGPSNNAQSKVKKAGIGCLISLIIFLFFIIAIAFAISATGGGRKVNTDAESTTALTKDQARDMDSQIWSYVVQVINANNNLMATMNNYSSGTVAEIDFYNASKDFESYAQSMWSAAPTISDSNGKKYLESCRDYIIIEQGMAQHILKYLDDKSNKNLSTLQNDIEQCNQAIQVVISNRGTFLSLNGFTEDEIKELANNLGVE